jgi:hypothetical protein
MVSVPPGRLFAILHPRSCRSCMSLMAGSKYFSINLRGMQTEDSPKGVKWSLSSTGIFKNISTKLRYERLLGWMVDSSGVTMNLGRSECS